MYKHIKYEITGSYVTSHPSKGDENEVWLIFHGYGQLATYFLRKFEDIFATNRLFVAPEAPNYGYLKGFSGKVGANWMTKHHRELAISNNNNFLNAIIEQVLHPFISLPSLHILGFSQGSATATRWASQLTLPVKSLTLWGGGFAHDLDLSKARQNLESTRLFMVEGNQDAFLTEKRKAEQAKVIAQLNRKIEKISYNGGHDIYPEPLKEIVNLVR